MEGEMARTPLAMGPGGGVLLLVVFLFALLFVTVFVGGTARRYKLRGERERRAGLGVLALLGGPLTGLALAFLSMSFSPVNPLDVGYTYGLFTGLGATVGVIVAFCCLLTDLLAPARAGGKVPPLNPPALWDHDLDH
jgi:hypothetical protein